RADASPATIAQNAHFFVDTRSVNAALDSDFGLGRDGDSCREAASAMSGEHFVEEVELRAPAAGIRKRTVALTRNGERVRRAAVGDDLPVDVRDGAQLILERAHVG